MEFESYQLVSNNTSSLNTGSYLNSSEHTMFVEGFASDLWFGFSANDVIELSIWDRNNTFIGWNVLNQSKSYNVTNLSYLNNVNSQVTYSYLELNSGLILHKSSDILVNPSEEVSSSFSILSGSYFLAYNFTREMAGNFVNPLVVKEISPSRNEIKLVPRNVSNLQYNAFCKKMVILSEVSPLYLQNIKKCPYGQIYNQINSLYKSEINTIKSIFFLTSDGAMVDFLKNLYEDVVTYTSVPKIINGIRSDNTNLVRTQGILTSFNNYLLTNSDTVVKFSDIDSHFYACVNAVIEKKFSPIGISSLIGTNIKSFIYDFFVKYFYQPVSNILTESYYEKYFSYFKNGLNLGNNRLLPILVHDFLDERESPSDPLTLLIKLQSELPSDITIQTQCWISNISLSPYVVSAIINGNNIVSTYKIGPPNFSIAIPNVTLTNSNASYTLNDLQGDDTTNNEVLISKNLTELNVDYTNFKNFVVFSSAEMRIKIFKNKTINLSSLSSSIGNLNTLSNNFLIASGSVYPYYTQEVNTLQGSINNIINSFDGYESYLYRSGNYTYVNGLFLSSSYVAEMDSSASYYDRINRDSLINNCPSHILQDSGNDEYIVFLSMIGHFFDEIYAYISTMPSEKHIGYGETESFTRKIVDYMLQTFGWNLDDILEQTDLTNNYLNSSQQLGLGSMSAEERLKEIRNRLLINLPRIYKTKGTEESIKTILSCYGIPSSLLSIREFGGVNYSDNSSLYTTYERSYMYQWHTSSVYDHFRTNLPTGCKTFLLKVCIDDATPYPIGKEQTMLGLVKSGTTTTTSSGSGDWGLGFIREPGKNSGKIYFRIGYDDNPSLKITSSTFPLFDGSVYSLMVRRNISPDGYEYNSNIDVVPSIFDLYVQKNEFGNEIIQLTSSQISYDYFINSRFSSSPSSSFLMLGGWFSDRNGQGFTGAMDKLQVWYDTITNDNFNDYANSINAYSFSGSRVSHQSLIFRMHTDYPFNMQQAVPGSSIPNIYIEPVVYDKWDNTNIKWESANWWWIMGEVILTSEFTPWKNANPFYAVKSLAKQEVYINPTIPANNDAILNWAAWNGAQDVIYDSASCQYVSQSVYPWQFKVIDYPSTWAISKYGPNKFQNEKVRFSSQSIECRFDSQERSTFVDPDNISPDSNQVGLFVDPQDFRNKDTARYFGNFDLMNCIGDPSNQFSSSYQSLNLLRNQYATAQNQNSGSRTLFNELITVFKLYFNQSIFETIKNVIPARSNIFTGVVITLY